ncbi:MAG: nitrate reductase molybdenum cofactor assembly chaperone [Hyphomicrobiales bacterium]
MPEDRRYLFKLLSVCLSYPDEALYGAIGEIEADLCRLTGPPWDMLQSFLAILKSQPLIVAQERYTQAFDLNPDTSLNFTYHLMGDGEDRGRALAELKEIYHRAGFEICVNELPDFLPLILEFLAQASAEKVPAAVRQCFRPVSTVAQRLKETGSYYAAVFEALHSLTPLHEAPTDDPATMARCERSQGFST